MRNKVLYLLLLGLLSLSVLEAGRAAEGPGLDSKLLETFVFRSLGPARQGARILSLAVHPDRPFNFYVATASGGVFKTENNGTTFTPVTDDLGRLAIGHLAMSPSDPDVLWIGTGDAASGRITIMGDGVYKTTDGGKDWTHKGLTETRHIGRIAIHPLDPNIVYVAALGYHFSSNPERGLYKTTDGGDTWDKVLFVNDSVGVVEVVIDPQSPDTVYAATYDKWRKPWHFEEAGPESGIYKSTDSGATWARLEGGLPAGKIGRIGLAVYPKDPKIVYATIDNFNTRPPTEAEAEEARSRDEEPEERRIGGEIYRSDDGGGTWTKMNREGESVGGGKWYGQIFIDPNDDKIIYVPNVRFTRSKDAGKTWGTIASGVHVDHHVAWINPRDSRHLITANDGGLAVSYDDGETFDVYENIPAAQFYAIGVDMDQPYRIYGGTQDTGSVSIPSNSLSGVITGDDWMVVGGGDGMYNQPDPEDSRWLYNNSQFGAIRRFDQKLGVGTSIRPSVDEGEPALRFNWNSPIRISPHNSRIIYIGSQYLHRSLNRGDDWQRISPDLTTSNPEKLKGNIEHCTITSISESPVIPGLIWVGTDDGKVQLTKNGGGEWLDRTAALAAAGGPGEFYVSRVFASHHEEGTAYAVKTGFQRDDFKPHVYKTTDHGEHWISISGNLPDEIIYVIYEDRKNSNLLFVGSDIGVFVSIDGGGVWGRLKNNMPNNAVHDLLIHPRENDLVVGSYGRGIYVTDISPLQEIDEKVLNEPIYLFRIEPKIQWRYGSWGRSLGHRPFRALNEPPGLTIAYYLKSDASAPVTITITDLQGEEINILTGKKEAGLHQVVWNMQRRMTEEEQERMGQGSGFRRRPGGRLLPPGDYIVELRSGDSRLTRKATLRPMPER